MPDVFDPKRRHGVHAFMAILVAIWGLGLITDRPAAHAALVTAQLAFAAVHFFSGINPGAP
jgi:hypothetical protein